MPAPQYDTGPDAANGADMKNNRDRHQVTAQYAKLAKDYDQRWSHYVRATTEATVERLPDLCGNLLDVGCGTGVLLERLQTASGESRLAGVDASAEMLEVARRRLSSSTSLCRAWAEELPFDDGTFDTVVSCNAFHFIRGPEAALHEMLRVLRPGGSLVMTDWCDDYLMCRLCDLYLRWFDPSHFRMYGAGECRRMLEAAGARKISIDRYKISVLWGLMTAQAYKEMTADPEPGSRGASGTVQQKFAH